MGSVPHVDEEISASPMMLADLSWVEEKVPLQPWVPCDDRLPTCFSSVLHLQRLSVATDPRLPRRVLEGATPERPVLCAEGHGGSEGRAATCSQPRHPDGAAPLRAECPGRAALEPRCGDPRSTLACSQTSTPQVLRPCTKVLPPWRASRTDVQPCESQRSGLKLQHALGSETRQAEEAAA
ncbi:hypothetical protein CB1_000223035 [Camelus ferus]|nr:hypothetical protein CB1_000223035 [Camelus ferus]